jgi:hypothetical protein
MHTKNGMDTNPKINNPEFHPFSTILSTNNFVLMSKFKIHECVGKYMPNEKYVEVCTAFSSAH